MAVAPGIIDTEMQTTIRGTTEEQFIHRQKFVDLKENGQLVPPQVAGKHLAKLLFSPEFSNGGIIDIRDTY
jgi:benzil reductase ((S)-benzoin forming)